MEGVLMEKPRWLVRNEEMEILAHLMREWERHRGTWSAQQQGMLEECEANILAECRRLVKALEAQQ